MIWLMLIDPTTAAIILVILVILALILFTIHYLFGPMDNDSKKNSI